MYDDEEYPEDEDTDDADDAKAATHRLGFFFRAWREVSSTGPIRKATLDTVHRMRADASAEARSAKAAPIGKRALADVTNENGKTTFTSERKKPSPPRRFFNLVASPFARRRHPDSPHSDWGSSSSDFESEGVSAVATARRSRGSAPGDRSSPQSDSSDVWMSAGAAAFTPGSVASGAVTSRPPVSPRFASAQSRRARASATPTVYFPFSPSSEDSLSDATARAGAPAPASPATPGSLSSEVSEAASLSPGALDRAADAFVVDDAKSPGPMGPVLHAKRHAKASATVYTLSPTSPLVGPRRGDSTSSSPGSESEASEAGRNLNPWRKRSSPPGSRANKHAAAAAVGAPAGFVTAARAAFEREAAANTFDAPTPARGSRVRR